MRAPSQRFEMERTPARWEAGGRRVLRGGARRLAWGAAILCVLSLPACGLEASGPSAEQATALTGGVPDRGEEAIGKYGCGACHTIPGIPGANRTVGPPLGGIGERMYIAGHLANNPDNLIQWIMNPQAIDPKTAMPNMGVTERDARDIVAYLYSIQ